LYTEAAAAAMSATTSLAADAPMERVAQNVFTYNQFRQEAANWLDEFARKIFRFRTMC
jgi:hypothetical protein